MLISPALAQQGTGGTGDLFSAMLPLVLIFVVFYFLLIRPQQKRQKEHKARLAAIRRGDKILTGGGILGLVTKVQDDKTLQVEIADGIRVQIATHTVTDVLVEPEAAKPASASDDRKPGLLARLLGGKGAAKTAPIEQQNEQPEKRAAKK